MSEGEVDFHQIERALKRCAGILGDAGIPFMLAGSLAAWARGGPETRNDLDLLLRRDDAERTIEALSEAGLRTERPAEQWLFKAWDGDVLIDLIFEILTIGGERDPVGDEIFDRGDELKVFGVLVRVMSLEDLLVTKLLALEENALDYGGPLAIARSLRERIDWGEVRERTGDSPFAAAFFTLAEGLDVVEPAR